MATIIGIDLAWSAKNESGLCVLAVEGGDARCERLEALRVSADDVTKLALSSAAPVIVAVDGPLILGSERMAERQLNSVFSRFNAGAYFASEAFLSGMNAMAGPELGKHLQACGFSLDPADLGAVERLALEVYPHPAHVVFFGLDRRLPYKRGTVAQKRAGLAFYQECLRRHLAVAAPGLDEGPAVQELLRTDPMALAGAALKRLEDTLDALTCALVGLRCYREGPAGVHVFGTGRDGYIVVPGPLPLAANRGPRGRRTNA